MRRTGANRGIIFRTTMVRLALAASAMLVCTSAAHAQDDLHKVLLQMDSAAQKFQSAQANFQWDTFEAAVQETDTERGVIAIEKHGGELQTAIRLNPPEDKKLVYRDGELKLYEPKIDHLTIFATGANRAMYESFLSLGFGGSGTDLEKSWTVKYLGREAVDGVNCARIDLVSKSVAVRNQFSHITLWVDTARGVSLKQQMFEPSGDYRTAHYTQVQVNAKIPAEMFVIKTTSKTTVAHK